MVRPLHLLYNVVVNSRVARGEQRTASNKQRTQSPESQQDVLRVLKETKVVEKLDMQLWRDSDVMYCIIYMYWSSGELKAQRTTQRGMSRASSPRLSNAFIRLPEG